MKTLFLSIFLLIATAGNAFAATYSFSPTIKYGGGGSNGGSALWDDPTTECLAYSGNSGWKDPQPTFSSVPPMGDTNGNCNFMWMNSGSRSAFYSAVWWTPICPAGFGYSWERAKCESNAPFIAQKSFGCCSSESPASPNPVQIGTGNKTAEETDYRGTGQLPLSFSRTYNSYETNRATIGTGWTHTFLRSIHLAASQDLVYVYRPSGRLLFFTLQNGTWAPDADNKDQLVQLNDTSGAMYGWQYVDDAKHDTEIYDKFGKLLSITNRNGLSQTLTYSTSSTSSSIALVKDLLIQVQDNFGRQLNFFYDNGSRIIKMTDPSGGQYIYAYAGGNQALTSVTYPDGKVRSYKYNDFGYSSGYYYVLTGIVDENGDRFASYSYDGLKAISTQHNAGSTAVEQISLTYNSDGTTKLVDSLNTSYIYAFQTVLGMAKNTSITRTCAAGTTGCSGTTSIGYDANGNIASRTDFNGNVTNYSYDLTRNLETSRTEAYGTALARTITTQWHSVYRLPTLISEPGKTTAFTYDTSGNVLSKTLTDTVLNKLRTWTYTYNALGQVLTADGPRTDATDKTTYTYYSSAGSVAGSVHSVGDLATVTNAVGLVTSITNYDLNGRPLSITDPNGVVTTLTYSPRGWLTSRKVNGVQTTSYDYDGVGQLTKVTLPDGSYLSYTYDTAHRLTDITDNAGNKIHYTLDAMGNRTQEDTKDPSNTILKTRSRIFDALNRLQKDIGGTSPTTQITQYVYDNVGNLKTITDPLNHVTTNGYDALNRLITITDPANGVSATTYNALDQTTQVKDPRLVTTNYTINALGDVTLTNSPDSGNTNNVYDAAGNVIQKTDARGIVSNYTYDALNRLKKITYPSDSAATRTFVYDNTAISAYSKGHLSYVVDPVGNAIVFYYDAYGNLTSLEDANSRGDFYSEYQYDNANRVIQITYNAGRSVIYTRNALGQITQVQTRDDANAALQTLVSNVTYEPFGPLKSISYVNGVTTTYQHDADYRVGRITTTSIPALDIQYGYDNASNLLSLNAGSTSPDTRTYSYDNLNRVTGDKGPLINLNYQYDTGGNLTQWQLLNSRQQPVDTELSSYASNSNRQVTYVVGSPMTLDAAGNVTQRDTLSTTYNAANQPTQTTDNGVTTTYQYNGLGWRNTKQNSTFTHYDYLPDGKLLAQIQLNADNTLNQTVEYVWLDDTPIAQIKTTYTANNTVSSRRFTYIHADHLNTPRLMTDSTKNVVWQWQHDAYGGMSPNANPDGDSTTDTLDLRFPGQIADSETGLFYNLNRYYDPLTARYTQSDPIGVRGGLNLYEYALDNPVNYYDPDGASPKGGNGAAQSQNHPLGSWPLNGNFWPGYNEQDGVCTTGSFADSMNSKPCVKKCCKEHDECYTKYHCNASSWLPGGSPFGACRLICNRAAVMCIEKANKSTDGCGDKCSK